MAEVKRTNSNMKLIGHKTWLAKAIELFGDDPNDWEFVCPLCGNVQSYQSFLPYKDAGVERDLPAKECLGRYFPANKRSGLNNPQNVDGVKKPCDYASYGLFNLCPVMVTYEDGVEVPAFGFNEDGRPLGEW